MRTFACLLTLSLLAVPALAQQDSGGAKLMKPALVVIDIQNEFLPMVPEQEKKMALEMINGAIWRFRQHKLPVIRVYHTSPEWGPKPGTEPFEFPASVIITNDDPKVVKNFPSAFKKTDLEQILREKGCNTLFLCGLSAVGCVLATYQGAIDRDFETFMIRDALMSHNSRYTDLVEEIFNTVSFGTLSFMLDHMRK